jgi:hypothetical protein
MRKIKMDYSEKYTTIGNVNFNSASKHRSYYPTTSRPSGLVWDKLGDENKLAYGYKQTLKIHFIKENITSVVDAYSTFPIEKGDKVRIITRENGSKALQLRGALDEATARF